MPHILLQVTFMTEHLMVSHGNQKLYIDSKWKHCPALNSVCWNSVGHFYNSLKIFSFCFTALVLPETDKIT